MEPRGLCIECRKPKFGIGDYCAACAKAVTSRVTEQAIEQASGHAEEVIPGWKADALRHFHDYALTHGKFLTEEVRPFAYARGLPVPPAPGAWGAVAREAAAAGYVVKDGMRASDNPEQHGKLMTLWKSLLI